jgi:hypothetical protein
MPTGCATRLTFLPCLSDNTNKLGLELYSVLAEMDGMGFPLAYMLLTTKTAMVDACTMVIKRFLECLRQRGVNPRFAMVDKDAAQIRAIKTVWPAIHIQLCYWHLKRAVKRQLASTKKPQQMRYTIYDAHTEFSFIDFEFYPDVPGQQTDPGQQADNAESCQQLPQHQVRSRTAAFTFCPPEHRNRILEIMVKHLHLHPLIPALDRHFYTSEQIREAAVREMYSYCKEHDLRWAWAYLWTEWYGPSKWVNWARSSNPEIPVLKTTMIVESHWRIIKYDYLYKFNRPRIDLLTWTLVERLIPRYIMKYQHFTTNNQRARATASWRPAFKRAWKECAKKECSNAVYETNAERWFCSCPAFLQSRFLLCKHLVQSVRPVRETFFTGVQRQRLPPFWAHASLNPLGQDEEEGEDDNVEQSSDDGWDEEDGLDEEVMEAIDDAEGDDIKIEGIVEVEAGESWEEVSGRVEGKLLQWINLLDSQRQYKDVRFWLAAENAMKV